MPSAMTASSMSLRTFAPQSEMSSRSSWYRAARRARILPSQRRSPRVRQRARDRGAACPCDCAKRRNAWSNSARTSSGSSTATHASRSFLSRTVEEPHGRRVAALEPRQLVHLRRQGALDVRRGEDRQRLLERLGDAPVVDDEPVGPSCRAVRFTRAMAWSSVCSLQRRVEVHDLLDRRVEAGEQHVADDEDRERVARVLEPLDQRPAAPRREVPARAARRRCAATT